jgi:hypothetical protein
MSEPPRHPAALVQRLIPALRLDLDLYVTVSADPSTTGQALLVVLLAGVLNGIGLESRLGSLAIWAGVGAGVVGWLLWAAVVWLTARVFGHVARGRSLLRALGFADAPGIFLVLGIVPAIAGWARALVVIWLLAATAVAVQAVYETSRRRGVGIALAAFAVYLLLGLVSAHFAA